MTYINIHIIHTLFRLSTVLLILLIAPSVSKGSNLPKNPDFEDGTISGWNTFGNVSIAALTTTHTRSYSSIVSKAAIQQERHSGRRSISDTNSNSRVGYTDLLIMVDQWPLTKPEVMPPYYSPDIYVYVYGDNKIELCDSAVLLFDWLSCNNLKESSCAAK